MAKAPQRQLTHKKPLRLSFVMGDEDHGRFRAKQSYSESWTVAHGLVDAGLASFSNEEDEPKMTESRPPTMDELRKKASSMNLAIYDQVRGGKKSRKELNKLIAEAEAAAETENAEDDA